MMILLLVLKTITLIIFITSSILLGFNLEFQIHCLTLSTLEVVPIFRLEMRQSKGPLKCFRLSYY